MPTNTSALGPLLPAISLLAGAALGLLSTILINVFRQRQDLTLRLLDQYFEVRKEVVGVVSKLTSLSLREPIPAETRANYRDAISRLFYQHYDFLPRPVLEALTLLHMCLADSAGRLYSVRSGSVLPMQDTELAGFVRRCSLFENARVLAPLALRSRDLNVRTNEAINLHARHVLYTLNEFVAIPDLLEMTKRLKKTPDERKPYRAADNSKATS